ncbi:ATP-dependent Clp protease adaptor ClpS [candidate division KSB1 bacterium]|nr:ATP-dependent Clp protease adaptor ClpS [candidate division KSB1 bacterium]
MLPERPDTTLDAEPTTRVSYIPQYNVVLWDDNDHTYDYVIEMLMKLFRHSAETAFEMACEVDSAGRVVVDTTSKERAEFKRDQIHAYGCDWRLERCKGSMSATIEAVDDEENN